MAPSRLVGLVNDNVLYHTLMRWSSQIQQRGIRPHFAEGVTCHLRATGLYDRRNDQVLLDEVERILI